MHIIMGVSREFLFLFSFIIWITSATKIPIPWDESCPSECQCQITTSSQTVISRWKPDGSDVKSAFCVFNNENIDLARRVPQDIEVFTFLQSNNGTHHIIILEDTLKHLKTIKSIDMQGSLGNATTQITENVFHDLQELKFLSLQRVDLSGAEKAFSKLASLEVLYVIYCAIGFLKWEMLDGLTNLKELYLVQSGIKELYGFAFYGTPELRRLFLSHNDLFSVDADAFVGLLKLEHLDLSNNRIDHLSGLTFPPLPHLQWLELKHNPIKVIFPHCFQFLNGTHHLTLGHTHQAVHLMKFSFRGLYSLTFLHIPNIDNDVLSEHMFYDLRSLQNLNLQGRVKSIGNRAFNGAHKLLKKLILHDCQLEKVHRDSFHSMENLTILDLSSNLLRSLPDGIFQQLKSLQQLFLNGNQLKTVPDDLFQPMSNLQVLRLHDNQWNCTCKMQYWKEEIVLAKYTIAEHTCDNDTNCAENIISDIKDIELIPKCDNPKNHKDENVFLVLKTMHCKGIIEN